MSSLIGRKLKGSMTRTYFLEVLNSLQLQWMAGTSGILQVDINGHVSLATVIPGGGDMISSTYDTNTDGRVNAADNATNADAISSSPGNNKVWGSSGIGAQGWLGIGTGATEVAWGNHTHSTYLLISDIDDVAVDGVTNAPISSNWAYDHLNATNPHNIVVGDIQAAIPAGLFHRDDGTWAAAPSASVPTQITIANEASDATCFPLFATAATGDLGPRSNAGLTFNSSTGVLASTFSGNLTGNVTGNASGTAATVTGAAQTNITSLGTLTALSIDNLSLDGNTFSSISGHINITPVAGSQIVLDGTVNIDAGQVTGITSLGLTGTRVTTGFFTDLTVTNAIAGGVTGNAGTATKLAATKTINGIAFDGSGNITVPSDITPGTSGNVLTSNGTIWTSAAPTGFANPMTTLGDIIYGGASGSPTRLGIGTALYVLRVNAGGNGLEWAASAAGFADPMTTRGDIIVRGSGGTTRLALGTNGYYLKSDGTDVVWAAVAGGGDVVGPASATDNRVAVFDGITGKLLKDGGSLLSDYVTKATYDANTILKADSDDTPTALTIAEQTLVGRITSGVITGLTVAEVKTLLGVAAASGIASLDGSSLVVQNPANATSTATASKIPIADGSAKLDTWLSDATDSVKGKVELATIAETDTGTSTSLAVTPDGLAGSVHGTKVYEAQLVDKATDLNSNIEYFYIPSAMDGMNLVRATAMVETAGTTNATTIQIRNLTKYSSNDALSTAISIASGGTIATAGTVNASYDDVSTNDKIKVYVTGQSTTAPKGLWVVLEFRLP